MGRICHRDSDTVLCVLFSGLCRAPSRSAPDLHASSRPGHGGPALVLLLRRQRPPLTTRRAADVGRDLARGLSPASTGVKTRSATSASSSRVSGARRAGRGSMHREVLMRNPSSSPCCCALTLNCLRFMILTLTVTTLHVPQPPTPSGPGFSGKPSLFQVSRSRPLPLSLTRMVTAFCASPSPGPSGMPGQ